MVVGFSGTRKGMTGPQLQNLNILYNSLDHVTLVRHGGCKGADTQFHIMVATNSKHRAELNVHWGCAPNGEIRGSNPDDLGPKEGYVSHTPLPFLIRNKVIVDKSDVMFAAPGTEQEVLRSGTWATIRYCLKKRKPLTIITPSGAMSTYP